MGISTQSDGVDIDDGCPVNDGSEADTKQGYEILTLERVRDVISKEIAEIDVPDVDEVKAAVRSGVFSALLAIGITAMFLSGLYFLGSLVYNRNRHLSTTLKPYEQLQTEADVRYQDGKMLKFLADYKERGTDKKGLFYLSPDVSINGVYRSPLDEHAGLGIFYVQPTVQTEDSEAMTLHLIGRLLDSWNPSVEKGDVLRREMVGEPKLVLGKNGAPVAAYVFYRYQKVLKND